ncbi:MAG: hypothetical protein JWQ48_3078 [Conexibacter sp.]|nr:hypothetical protein [Conexibacter sp.]
MRTLVISDLHLGAWTGDDLLAYDWARELLRPELERADELVLLGDMLDLLFSTMEHAFERADGLMGLLAETLAGKRVVWLAGNHDHHILVRRLAALVELRIATGKPDAELLDELSERFYFEAFMRRRLPDTELVISYPTHRVGEVLLSHGHYLDGEVRGSLPNRLLQGGFWRIAGGRTPNPTIEDYEASMVPLTELLFVEAQLPKGAAAEQRIQADVRRLGQIVAAITAPERELARAGRALLRRARGARPLPVPAGDFPLGSAIAPGSPAMPALRAFARVCRNLGWSREATSLVFAHTHQPLAGVRPDDDAGAGGAGDARYWNTGSWIYEPPADSVAEYVAYLDHSWPGSAIVIDSEEQGGAPQLLELLAGDRAALRALLTSASPPDPADLTRYDDVRRLLAAR